MKRFFTIASFAVMWIPLLGQDGSVGIGTQTPNNNAVLHLVAPENNQGLLVPQLTSDQKKAFASKLTFEENGMLIYDTDDNQFYYWVDDHWQAVGFSFQVGSGLSIVDGIITNTGDPDASDDFSGIWSDLASIPLGFQDGQDDVDDADNDPANELQDLNLSGTLLTITGITSPTTIDLSTISGTGAGEQDLQFSGGQITLSGDPDATVIDLSNYDMDASDDFTGADETDPTVPAAIKDGIDWTELGNVPAGFVDDTDDVDDADADPVNELQDLDLTNNILTITGIGSPNPIDLSPYSGTNTDSQDLSLSGNTLSITGDPNTDVDLSKYLDNTDIQDLQFSAGRITLSGDPDGTIINLSNYDTDASDDFTSADETDPTVPAAIKDGIDWTELSSVPAGFSDNTDNVDDADNNPTNELQVITTNNTPGNITLSNDKTVSMNVNDNDANPSNELQDLNLSGNILTITGIASPTDIDLSPFAGTNTDEQDLQFSAGMITLSGDPDNTIIDLSNYDTDATDDFTTADETDPTVPAAIKDGIDWTELSSIPAGFSDDTDDVDDADNNPANELQVITTNNTPGNITLSNDKTLSMNVNDNDANPTNELQDLNLSGSILTITGIASPTDIDLSPFAGTNTDEQDLQFSAGLITLSGDPDNTIIDLSNYDTDVTDDFTAADETDPTVPAAIKDGIDWTELSSIPAGFSDDTDDVDDADADPSNELQELQFSAGLITLSDDPTTTIIDLSNYDTDVTDDFTGADETDPVYGASEAANITAADITNLSNLSGTNSGDQNLSLTGNTLSLSGDVTPVDLSGYLDSPWTEGADAIGSFVSYTGHTKTINSIHTPLTISNGNINSFIIGGVLSTSGRKTVIITTNSSTTIERVNGGLDGQELIIIYSGNATATLRNDLGSSNLYLSATSVVLNPGGSITLMYVADLLGWVTINQNTTVVAPN